MKLCHNDYTAQYDRQNDMVYGEKRKNASYFQTTIVHQDAESAKHIMNEHWKIS